MAEQTVAELRDTQRRIFLGELQHGGEEEARVLQAAWERTSRAPAAGPWLTAKGYLEQRNDQYERAVETLGEATAQDPQRGWAWALLGQTHVVLHVTDPGHDPAPAEGALQRALELEPDMVLALESLAKLELLRHLPERAMQIVERAISLEPSWWKLYHHRAWARMDLEDMPGAAEDLQQAQDRGGVTVDWYMLLARYHLGQRDMQQCLGALNELLAIDPTHIKARINRAGIYATLQSPERGLRELDALLQEDMPDHWRARTLAARIDPLVRLERFDEALTAAREAARLSRMPSETAKLESLIQQLEGRQ
jgi:tetratricopeptide (TPR) repeat protein